MRERGQFATHLVAQLGEALLRQRQQRVQSQGKADDVLVGVLLELIGRGFHRCGGER